MIRGSVAVPNGAVATKKLKELFWSNAVAVLGLEYQLSIARETSDGATDLRFLTNKALSMRRAHVSETSYAVVRNTGQTPRLPLHDRSRRLTG